MFFFRDIGARYLGILPFITSLFMVTGRGSLQGNIESTQEIVTKNLLTIGWALLIIGIWSSINLYGVNSLLSAGYLLIITTILLQLTYWLNFDQIKPQARTGILVGTGLFLYGWYIHTNIGIEYSIGILLCVFFANVSTLYRVQNKKTSDLLSQQIIAGGSMIARGLLIATGVSEGYGIVVTQTIWSMLIYGHFLGTEGTTKFDSQRSDVWSLVRGSTLSQIRGLKEHDFIHSVTKSLPINHFRLLYLISTSIAVISLCYLGYQIWTGNAGTTSIICSFFVILAHTITMALSNKEYMHQHIEIINFAFWYILVYFMIAVSPLSLLLSIITGLLWYILNGVLLNNYSHVTNKILSKETYMQWLGINTIGAIINILMLLSLNTDISTTATLLLLFAGAVMILTSYNRKFIQSQNLGIDG